MAAATKSGSGKERGLRRCTAKEKKEKIRQAEDAARREERDEGI